jgi:NADPH:quinone reductase-like Zn-dependent oxidoreductase
MKAAVRTRYGPPEVVRVVDAGAFRPVVDRCYPLDQIVEAYRYVETGQKIGSVVISMDGPHRDGCR